VREEAESRWPSEAIPHIEQLMIKITYFYDEDLMDVDNIPKPISDALNGLVYHDDEQLTDNYTRKRNLTDDLRVENRSTVLASGLSLGTDFLYIVIDEAPNQKVID